MREIKINLSKIRASLIGFNCLENLIFLFISPQGRKQGIMKREGNKDSSKATEFIFMKANSADILPKRTHSENGLVHLSGLWKIYIS